MMMIVDLSTVRHWVKIFRWQTGKMICVLKNKVDKICNKKNNFMNYFHASFVKISLLKQSNRDGGITFH
jgi:hypothetical protein